jgi:starch synthase (maltosyl-transferring)
MFPHVVIDTVTPQIDGGRHPIKRTLGERLRVGAAIFKDGHDLIGARVLYRPATARVWLSAAMTYEFDPDRWFAELALDQLGVWYFTVEAWPDAVATWQSDLRKRLDAGQDVAGELLEGAALLRAAAAHAESTRAREISGAAERIGNASIALGERIAAAASASLAAIVDGPVDPSGLTRLAEPLRVIVDRERARFGAWYEMFPRSQAAEPGRHGTFADAARRLPEIAALGFDVVYLPPIHPIGVTHRKGPDNSPVARPGDPGSPWAIGSLEGGHTAIHPQLGTFADFAALLPEAERHGLEIAIDYALQCSPDHPWVREHPDWFFRRVDGSIHYAENPPKKYEDIFPLNFWCDDREGLWNACRDVLLFWIGRGVKIFRVDNPHTKPFAFWEWCLAEVRARHPDVVFLSEAFTRPNRMKMLAKIGFDQSYTYFTWKNTKWELSDYLAELTAGDIGEYFRPNFFANTPDILHDYLQQGGRAAFRIRLVLAATLAPSYGIYSGYELCENVAVREGSEEYAGSEKYEVRVRDWNAPGNIKEDLRTLNRVRRAHAALQRLDGLAFLPTTNDRILCYRRSAPGDELIVVVNLDPHGAQETIVTVPIEELGLAPGQPYRVEDLLSGATYEWRGRDNYVRLDPSMQVAHVLRVDVGGAPGAGR